jgi:hypothetical protein
VNYGEREMTRIYIGAYLLLNQQNYILQAERIPIAGIDEIKKNIRRRVWNDTEDRTKGMNGDKMDITDKERQKRYQEVTILVQVKWRITNGLDQKESSTQLGIS